MEMDSPPIYGKAISPRIRKHYPKQPSFTRNTSTATTTTRISGAIKGSCCAICLTHIAGRRPAVIAGCFHAYCLGCLLRWSNYKRICPLCNSHFDSYFAIPSLSSSRSFQKHRLLPLPRETLRGRDIDSTSTPMAVQRVLRRTREEINAANRRSRPLPRQRSFRRLGSLSSFEIAEKVLQWRASIYKLGLLAVPFKNKNLPQTPSVNAPMSSSRKEQILLKIEPWIQRELEAILHDPNPTIIVHVATSLYLTSVEKKSRVSSGCADTEETLLASLRPFLYELTTTFWHELRCYAESPYTMETYDEVVEYRKSG